MAKDYTALKNFLETDPGFDASVRDKSLRPLLTQLNSEEAGQTAFRTVPLDDVKEAIGDGVRALTAEQLQTLRLLIGTGADVFVDFRKPNLRAEILQVFRGQTAVLNRLGTLARRTQTYGERFGFEVVTKQDLWQVLPQIFKSYMAEYRRRG